MPQRKKTQGLPHKRVETKQDNKHNKNSLLPLKTKLVFDIASPFLQDVDYRL